MSHWADHYGAMVGQNFQSFLTQIGQRANFVRAQLPDAIPFEITLNGGEALVSEETEVVLSGRGWLNVDQILIEGREEALEVTWEDDETWSAPVLLAAGENTVVLHAVDLAGNPAGSDQIEILVTAHAPVFVRGDANLDGGLNLTDALLILAHVFRGADLACADAADTDDSESLDALDALALVHYLFLGGDPPPAPFPGPGQDSPGGGTLGCTEGLPI
jgi:hypothetical protein